MRCSDVLRSSIRPDRPAADNSEGSSEFRVMWCSDEKAALLSTMSGKSNLLWQHARIQPVSKDTSKTLLSLQNTFSTIQELTAAVRPNLAEICLRNTTKSRLVKRHSMCSISTNRCAFATDTARFDESAANSILQKAHPTAYGFPECKCCLLFSLCDRSCVTA